MNFDLELENGVFASTITSNVMKGLDIEKKTTHSIFWPALSSFKNVMKEFGSFPDEMLFWGPAEDGLSVLLNTEYPIPGPILVAGDSDECKTDFLKDVVLYIVSTHQPHEIQYGVIINCPS